MRTALIWTLLMTAVPAGASTVPVRTDSAGDYASVLAASGETSGTAATLLQSTLRTDPGALTPLGDMSPGDPGLFVDDMARGIPIAFRRTYQLEINAAAAKSPVLGEAPLHTVPIAPPAIFMATWAVLMLFVASRREDTQPRRTSQKVRAWTGWFIWSRLRRSAPFGRPDASPSGSARPELC